VSELQGGPTAAADGLIICEDVSRFYGEVLGINNVNLSLPPGVTALVGPNGAGKTTLLNLLTGLIRPTRGRVRILGLSPQDPERLFRLVGYCTQFDAFPPGNTGLTFIRDWLRLHGLTGKEARLRADEALDRVGLTEAAHRKVAAYSKGMRQRLRLAQAISHHPRVLILDEPLNGLDPMARAETLELFAALARQGMHVVVSSHILHEVDRLADRVVLLSGGYVVADGQIAGVRSEVTEHPVQILVRCQHPHVLASRLFACDHVVEAKLHRDGGGLLVRTRDANAFYDALNQLVVREGLEVESVSPADDDVLSLYRYLIGSDGEGA
jgi:ABC-2 type transport system ATP-binding protein